MEHYAGLDVSLELSSVCIVDERGTIVRETKVPSEPEDLVRYFEALEHPITRIALEAGPLSQWLHGGRRTGQPDPDFSPPFGLAPSEPTKMRKLGGPNSSTSEVGIAPATGLA